MKKNDVKEMVISLLNNQPHLRDNDERLIATFQMYEIGGKEKLQTISAFEFLKMIIDKKLTSGSTISRARRKIQETMPETRGINYEKRKKREKEIRKNVNDLFK